MPGIAVPDKAPADSGGASGGGQLLRDRDAIFESH
jgi:hypothetical protein